MVGDVSVDVVVVVVGVAIKRVKLVAALVVMNVIMTLEVGMVVELTV